MRTIAISKMLVDFLKNIKNECQYTEFVLADEPKHLLSNNAVNKSLVRACKRAKIKTVTLHNLRHTHGSILLYKGFSILYISKRLGHASTLITQEIYLHLLDELK